MLRNKIFGSLHYGPFRHRSREILRIEALSDAVFAFSVSILAVSLEVPQTFEELLMVAKGALPFFATVGLLFLYWYQQYIFFRRYGVNDFYTILLNLIYLAVILFYVYPLKFLFSLLLGSWTGINLFPKAAEKGLPVIEYGDFAQLIILFSIGYFVTWFIIYLLHRHILGFSQKLDFNNYELHFTRKEKRGALWNAFVGFTAILLAWAGLEPAAGICYLLIPFLLFINEWLFRRQIKNHHTKPSR
jgi:uncharacterized membrane protein